VEDYHGELVAGLGKRKTFLEGVPAGRMRKKCQKMNEKKEERKEE